VFAFIIVLALGGFAVARITGLPKEAPVQVGTAVRITPPSGWEVKESEEGAVWLSRGSANLRVVTGPAPDTSPEDLAKVALDALREDARGPLLVSDPESLTAGGGHPASRVAYQGQFGSEGRVTIVQGEVTAVVAPSGTGVVFDAWSLPEIYPYEEGDVHKMIEEAEIR
jgi:hypothetical protein